MHTNTSPLSQFFLLPFLILTLTIAACTPSAPADEQSAQLDNQQTLTLDIQGNSYNLELATTAESRHQGLSDRPSIQDDQGMLFVFPYAQNLSFYMRHCHFPIDLIYLDSNARVITTYHMETEPYDTPEYQLKLYPSIYPAQFAIELQGNQLEKLHLKQGDLINLPLDKLKNIAQ